MPPLPPPSRSPGSAPDPLWPLFLDVLRHRGHVTFMVADLGEACGIVNLDRSVIVLDRRNDQAVMRSTVGHELEHLDCPDCPEAEIEQMTAELLVPLPEALAAAQLTVGVHAVADRLGVDPQLVRARIRSVTAEQDAAGGVG